MKIKPLEYRVLVELGESEVDKRTREAGLVVPEDASERERAAQIKAKVVLVGGNAFEDWKDDRTPQAGDMVLIAKYSGLMIPEELQDGNPQRLLNDKDIAAIIE